MTTRLFSSTEEKGDCRSCLRCIINSEYLNTAQLRKNDSRLEEDFNRQSNNNEMVVLRCFFLKYR